MQLPLFPAPFRKQKQQSLLNQRLLQLLYFHSPPFSWAADIDDSKKVVKMEDFEMIEKIGEG